MGCGSSTLKGEKVEDITAPQPIKKVRTNFSDVDFSGNQSTDQRRPTVALAPDEQQRRPTKISEDIEEEPDSGTSQRPSKASGGGSGGVTSPAGAEADGYKLEPYRAPDGDDDDLASPTVGVPKIRVGDHDPTSSQAKEEFAAVNSPANKGSQSASASGGSLSSTSEQGARRKSWLARFKEASRDKSMEISDEDLKKHTGMTRAEFDEWKKDPKNRVGAHQKADAGVTYGADAIY